MTTDLFTAKVDIPNKPARYIQNCRIYKGVIASVYEKGVGKVIETVAWTNGYDDAGENDIYERYEDAYKPYFNSTMFEKYGLTSDDVRGILKENGDEYAFSDERLLGCMFVLGENPNGYFVHNYDLLKKEEERKKYENTLTKIKEETGFDFIEEKTTTSYDEDGKTPCYHYLLRHESGIEYRFSDRNVFDFGRCINPLYEIAPEWGTGGLMYKKREKAFVNDINELVFAGGDTPLFHVNKNGDLVIDEVRRTPGNFEYWCKTKNEDLCESESGDFQKPGRIYFMQETDELWWHSCCKEDGKFIGWQPVRKVEDLELVAYNIVRDYGSAYSGIRM